MVTGGGAVSAAGLNLPSAPGVRSYSFRFGLVIRRRPASLLDGDTSTVASTPRLIPNRGLTARKEPSNSLNFDLAPETGNFLHPDESRLPLLSRAGIVRCSKG